MDGILVVDKPEGITSAAVVRRIKQRLGGKVGHLGTLDPFASGVLPLCLGEGTKIAQFLNTADKSYEGVIRLGAQTDSGDRTGATIYSAPIPPLTPEQCAEVAARFRGEQWQTPPMYSAIKQKGVPLYKLARRGIEVDRPPRRVCITELCIDVQGPERLRLRASCSKGTYLRVLAEDIGKALGTAGHLEALRRTRFGRFGLEHAVPLEVDLEGAAAALLSLRRALDEVPEVHLDAATAVRARRGQVAALAGLSPPPKAASTAKLIGPGGDLLAVVVRNPAGLWEFARVLRCG